MVTDPMVEYIDVYKAFDAPVLAGVNLFVEEGETMSIVGVAATAVLFPQPGRLARRISKRT